MSDPQPEDTAAPAISVVMPVLNEVAHLQSAVERILAQDYAGPVEVVLALGPSTDGTDDVARAVATSDARVRLVPNPTGGTAAGLNAAVAAAHHDILVRVDGHGLLTPGYLTTVVELLERTGADNVGGVMAAEGRTVFECAVAAAMTSKIGVGNARWHVGGTEGPADSVYLGSFRRSVLDRLGGFDERFTRVQDWELNHRIRTTGGLVWFSPRLQVTYRPRRTLRALASQYQQYGRWRRVTMRRYPSTASARYLAAPAATVAVAGSCLGALVTPWSLVVVGGYAAALIGFAATTSGPLAWRSRLLLPVVTATMHLAWGAGFLTSPRSLAGSVGAGRTDPDADADAAHRSVNPQDARTG